MSAYSQQSNNIFKTWLLIFLFVGLVSGLFYGLAYYYNNPFWAVFGLIMSLGQAFGAYFFGDKIALWVARAEEIGYEQAPQLHHMVENLSKIADIPKPKIYISPDQSANAFACGRDPKHASICLNQGLLDILNKNELEGVVAHELGHIKNRDILIMTVVMVLASLVSFIADIGGRLMIYNHDRNRNNKSPIMILLYLVTLMLAPLVALLIQLAISRSREYLADATAVTITRYPEGLIQALQKLYHNPVPTDRYATSMNHFYIAPVKKSWGQKTSELFSTHPSIEDRIAALSKM
jgi:heat shock protein HtpX